jgi:hypothetical protein
MPQPIPVRKNFAPLLWIAGLGWVKGSLVVATIGTTLGVGAAYAAKATYTPGVDNSFDALTDYLANLKSMVSKGIYSGPANKISFYSTIGFGNGMRICAYTAEQAKEQTLFMLYACYYASGDEKFLALAEDYEDAGSWFGPEETFTDYESAEKEMQKVLGMMRSSSNPLVRDMTYDFALIANAACMQETDRGVGIELTGGEKPCGDMGVTDRIWEVLDGLFFFGGKPCMMTKLKWRKTKIMVYVPMALMSGVYLMPIITPLFKIGTKGLQRLADKDD